MARKSVNSNVDRRVFRSTAARTKAINVRDYNYRGGIRL